MDNGMEDAHAQAACVHSSEENKFLAFCKYSIIRIAVA
jgi:hypothetical protein